MSDGALGKEAFTAAHFKGGAGKQVRRPVGKVRDSGCVGMHTWPGRQIRVQKIKRKPENYRSSQSVPLH